MAISKELDETQRAIISIHREMFDESPTPMKLQKLCYYAQGYRLAEGKQQFPDELQAWQHGPVNYDLFQAYRDLQWRQINQEIDASELANDEFLREVVGAYGRFDGAALSTMTHREEPWLRTREGLSESAGSDRVIAKELIGHYFKRIMQEDDTANDL